jgi:tRNA (cytidine32/uridine32-2'-O)-methyltransferase
MSTEPAANRPKIAPALTSSALAALANVRVVLVGTTLARNIGSAARAMKVMGLRHLALASPQCVLDEAAFALAAGAEDLLHSLQIFPDLASAVADCALVLGTSARRRDIVLPEFAPADAAARLLHSAQQHPVALVFGAERVGLDNRELGLCQGRVQIPTDPDYSSLNLAAAVQLLAYELRLSALQWDESSISTLAMRTVPGIAQDRRVPATLVEFERFIEHFAHVLKDIRFYSSKNPEKLLTRLRRLFQRAELDQREIQILRGVLSETQNALSRAEKSRNLQEPV